MDDIEISANRIDELERGRVQVLQQMEALKAQILLAQLGLLQTNKEYLQLNAEMDQLAKQAPKME